MTKTQKIYKAITRNKNGLSTAAIRERFGINNVSAFINDLRRQGVSVKSVPYKNERRWVA